MDEVRDTRESVLITKRGKPVAKLVPAEQANEDFIGRLKGQIEVVGDIESPVETPDAWESAR